MEEHKIRFYREKLNVTQTELANRAGVSLRTIQRLESGVTPKGHTLDAVASALGIEKSMFIKKQFNEVSEDTFKIKMINLATLSFIIVPFGNLLFPFLVWKRNRTSQLADQIGRKIIDVQILWSLLTSILLIILPFVQKALLIELPLVLCGLALAFAINVIIILRNTRIIHQNRFNELTAPIHFL